MQSFHDNTQIVIRPGIESDCFTVSKLIKNLANDVGLLDPVRTTTTEDLIQNAFRASPPVVYVLVAELSSPSSTLSASPSSLTPDSEPENTTIVGYALYYKTYSTWKGTSLHIENIFVCKEHRRQRIGEKLLQYLGKIVKQENYARLSFECTTQNESALKFFQKYGAADVTLQDRWESYRFTKSVLQKLTS